jgi:uncharacterized protein
MDIIARQPESKDLISLIKKKSAQFIAITGRRRIGKTFLVRNIIQDKQLFFEVVAQKGNSKNELKNNFLSSYEEQFKLPAKLSRELSWREIFLLITDKAKRASRDFIVFLDEMPWMVESDFEFLGALEHSWNSNWNKIDNFKLIICGSATSWIQQEIINNPAGLFNRLTATINLQPFSITDCRIFNESKQLKLSKKQILDYYLVFGGVPYYWNLIEPLEDLTSFLGRCVFRKGAILNGEYSALIQALFRNSQAYEKIISTLGESRYGLNRAEILLKSKVSVGSLERALRELCDCTFVTAYVPFGYSTKNTYFRLTDEFMYFYITWLKKLKPTGIENLKDYWLKQYGLGKYHNWRGASFELCCQRHVDLILQQIGISGIRNEISTWRSKKMQIDLVIERADRIITLIECKYSDKTTQVSKSDIAKYLKRQSDFVRETKTRKTVNSVLVSSFGAEPKEQIKEAFFQNLAFVDLF